MVSTGGPVANGQASGQCGLWGQCVQQRLGLMLCYAALIRGRHVFLFIIQVTVIERLRISGILLI